MIHRLRKGRIQAMEQINKHPLYGIWAAMKRRCNNPNCKAYRWYGARGIKVCPEWAASFRQFAADVGERPTPKHQLERLDNGLGYQPGNVTWATSKEQMRNVRSNVNLTHNGKTQTVTEWAEELGLPAPRLYWRHHQGLPVEQVLAQGERQKGTPPLSLTMGGITDSLRGWARRQGLSKTTISGRLERGWPVEKALTTPSSRRRPPSAPVPG